MQSAQVVCLADYRSRNQQPASQLPTIYDVISGASTSEQYRDDLIEYLEIPGSYLDQLDVLIKIREEGFAIALEANRKFQLGQWTLERIHDKHLSVVVSLLGFDAAKESTF